MGRIGAVLSQRTTTPTPASTGASSRIGQVLRSLASATLSLPARLHQATQSELVRLGRTASRVPTAQAYAPALGKIVRQPLNMLGIPTEATAGLAIGTEAGEVARGLEREAQNRLAASFADELGYGAAGSLARRAVGTVSRIGQVLRNQAVRRGLVSPEVLAPTRGAATAPSRVVREAELVEPRRALPASSSRGILPTGEGVIADVPTTTPVISARPATPARIRPPVRQRAILRVEELAATHPTLKPSQISRHPQTGELRVELEPGEYAIPISRQEAEALEGVNVVGRDPSEFGPAVFRDVPPGFESTATGLQFWYKRDRPVARLPRYPRSSVSSSVGAPSMGTAPPGGLRGEGITGERPSPAYRPLIRARQQAIQVVARELVEQSRAMRESASGVFRAIRQSGGISTTRGGGLTEEIRVGVPAALRRSQGLPIDQMAQVLASQGYLKEGTTNELLAVLASMRRVKPPTLAQLRAEAIRIVDSEPGGRILEALQTKGATSHAIRSVVKEVTHQTAQEIAGGLRQVRGLLRQSQRQALTPAQLARFARMQRMTTGQETPLTPEELVQLEQRAGQIVPRAGQPTGTPPSIPTSRALVPAEVPRPIRDLNQFQSTPFSGLDPSRAAQLLDNTPQGPTQRQVIAPLRRSELAFRQEQQRTLHQLRQVSGNLREGSTDSRRIFYYLEGRMSLEQLSPKAQQTAQWMAHQFDDLLGRVNQARESIGKRPILRRKGYITHIQSPSLWEAMREAFTNAPDEATKNLQTAFFEQLKARGPGFRFGLPRKGGLFEEDAVRAFKAYLPAALRVIHLSEPSRLASVYINRNLAGTPNASRYFSQLVRQVATGEQGPVAKLFPHAVVQASNWIKGRFGKGTILGNFSSVLQQPFTLPSTIAQNGPEASTAAAVWIARGDGTAFAMQWSPTLQARIMEMDVDFTRLASKWDVAMGSMFAAADRTMVAHAFNSGYLAAVKKGATFQQAIEAGEQSALRTQSSFLTADMAPVFRDAISSGFLQFQNTINGVFNFLKFDVPRAQNPLWAAGAFVGTFAAMAAIYEALGLPHPDQISDFVPGLSTTRSGGPVGIKLLTSLSNLGSSDERKRGESIRALWSIVPAIAFGAGGNQIRKSFQGLQAVGASGKFDARGRMQFPVRGITEQARALAFGPYQTKAGQAYIQRGFEPEPLTETQKAIQRRLGAMRRRISPTLK